MAKSVTRVAPTMAKVLFENDKVCVVELNMKKGDKIPEHVHGPCLACSVTSFDYKSTTGGKTEKRRIKARQVDWSDGESHAVEATENGHALIAELKWRPRWNSPTSPFVQRPPETTDWVNHRGRRDLRGPWS